MNIINNSYNTVVNGTEGNDSIRNGYLTAGYVTINALGGDDTIDNGSSEVSINAGAGNDSIDNYAHDVTIRGGVGDDSITVYGHNLIIYNAGDGNDFIEGLTRTATLSIADTGYATTKSGKDLIAYVEDGSKITLKGVTPAYISGRPGKFVSSNLDNTENNILIIGSDSKNRVTNSGKGVTILTNGGKDSITNRGQNAKLDGGAGNDSIHNYYGSSNVTINGGDGNDSISNNANNVTISGGVGNDSIFNMGKYTSLDGGAGNDSIVNVGEYTSLDGGEGNDFIRNRGIGNAIFGGEGDDKINIELSRATVEGGKGDDRIDLGGNAKNALIQYTLGDGNDSIYGFRADSTLDIGDGNSATLVKRDGNMVVKFGENEIVLVGAANLTPLNIRGMRDEVVNIRNGRNDALLVGGNFDDTIYNSYGRNVTVFGQGGNDSITNYNGKNAIINGGANNDTLRNDKGESSSIFGGDGNDFIFNYYSTKNVLIDGGADNDFISNGENASNVTINGGADNDSIRNLGENVTISGGDGNDSITNDGRNSSISGGAGNDSILNSNNRHEEYSREGSNVTINGGAGDDSISNESGGRVLFQYNLGDGFDTISGFRADSTLSIAGGIYTSEKSGNDVIVTVGNGKITLQGAATLKNVNIVETPVNIHNADRYKYITLTNANDTIINTGESVTIQALRGNDSINNNALRVSIDADEGNDKISNTGRFSTILGNAGNDSIYNNSHKTSINAGIGNDYIFNNGWSAKIFGNAGKNTIENYNKSNEAIITGGTENDSIKNSSDKVTISGNTGNDTILSNGTSNFIDGGAGNDFISIEGSYTNTILGGLGNDTINLDWSSNKALIRFNASDGNDVINGFNATSTLQLGNGKESYSKSISGEDVIVNFGEGNITLKGAANLSRLHISGVTTLNANNTLNGVLISGDRLNDTVINGGNNVTINTFAGNDTIQNSGSRVTIDGGDDDDIISNTDGNNVSISGVVGNDSISNTDGHSVTIVGGAGNNSISNTNGNFAIINSGNGQNTISNTNSNNVSIVGGTGKDYISDTNSKNSTIDSGDNSDTIIASGGFRNVINGGNNSDNISVTNANNVTIFGGNHEDKISVSGGFRNVIVGGKDFDTIYISPTESDVLIKHDKDDNHDTIYGFNETSTLQLGDGTDTFSREENDNNIIITTGDDKIMLVGAATLSVVNVFGTEEGREFSNSYNSNTIISGSSGDDIINNGHQATNNTIYGNAGNDFILNYGKNNIISGGAGNDILSNNKRGNSGTNVTISGGEGNDSIVNSCESVSIDGGAGLDTIDNRVSQVTINGGVGDDSIGLNSNHQKNMIQYMEGDGNDTIKGFNSTDTLGIFADNFTTTKSGSDIIVTVGENKITLQGAAALSRANIIHDERELPLNINNANNDVSIIGTSLEDTLSNGGSYVTISARDGNDTINNSGNNVSIGASAGDDSITNNGANVTISGEEGKDYILNDNSFNASISGGESNDTINVIVSSQVTVNAGKADDVISLRGSDETFIEYTAGDGNDKIYGFNDMATLDIAKTEFTSATSGKDIIITVGDGRITLDGAATLSNPHIVNGTHATFTIKNSAVTCDSDLPESIIKDAYQFNADSSLLTINSALQNYTVNVKAENAGKVKWHYGTASLSAASTLEYKLENGKNTAALTSKNYGDKITFDEDTNFKFGRIEAEVLKASTVTAKGAKRISFENNSSANVTTPRDYQIDVSASNIMVNDLPINAHNGTGTITVQRRGLSFSGYGVQLANLEVATESYFGKLAPMSVAYNSSEESYTIQNTARVKTLSSDFTKITFDFSTTNEKYAYYKVNDVAFLVASDADDINVIETDGTNFKIQDKEINTEKIGRVTIDEQLTFSGTEIEFEGVKTTYAHNKPVSYSLDGNTISISDAATITTGDETKTFNCEAGSYTINGRTFETTADTTFTADTNEIKISLKEAATEIYFDGVKVSGSSGELVFDLASNKVTIPSGAALNITSPQEVKLNLAAGNFTIDGKKISVNSELEITADKDNVKVPLSSNGVNINGAKITGTGEATIDNTNELFCSVLLPNGAFVQNTSESIYQLSGEGSTASFGGANKKVQLTDNSTTYIEYYKENTISVGFNRFMFETAEIKGSDWTIETSGTAGIDKIAGITSGATVTPSTQYVDAGDLRFEVETDGAGTFIIAGQKITSTDKNIYVVYGNSKGEIKVAPLGEEYAGDNSEEEGKIYNFDTAGDYTVNGITFHATENSKVQTITRGVEFDLSTGTFQYDGLTLSGSGAAQINRYNAGLVSLTDGAKVSGSDESKYQNRQFEISGAVELIGKKFETNEQIRCGLVNVQDTIDGQTLNLKGFYVDDKYVQIQSDCYERVKVVDKNISSIEGVKDKAEITGNGLPNVSIVTTGSGEFKIHDNAYKITDDPDGVTFVMDSHGNIAEINGLSGSVAGNFENAISVNGKAVRLSGASSITVKSDGEKLTEISNVAGDSVKTGSKTYRKNIRVYELGGAAKLTASTDGTIIFSGNKFEMSAGKTFTLDEAGNVVGLEKTQSDSASSAASVAELEDIEENFGTINLSTTSNLDEVIGDFSEGLEVNGVLVKVTGSTNFAVKNDDKNIYIETTAPDTFTINGKTFTTSADKTIFKLDASGNISEIVTDKFYLYPDQNYYLIEGDFSDEIIFNGEKFCVTGTNDTTIFVGDETLIGVDLARNAVEVVESGGASEVIVTSGGNITIGGKTLNTSDNFIGLIALTSEGSVGLLENFVGTLSGKLGGLGLAQLKIDSEDAFSVTGDGEKVTAIENLLNGSLTGDNLDAITINGEKLSVAESDDVTLTIADGKLKTSDNSDDNNDSSDDEILDKLKAENPDYITVSGKANRTLGGGDLVVIEDTSAKVNITASKGNDTIVSKGENVSIKLNSTGKTDIFATGGKMTLQGYDAATGSGFHTDYADIFEAINSDAIDFYKGKLTIDSAVVDFDENSKLVNFYDAAGELQKVGFASEDSKLDASKQTGNLILVGGNGSTIAGGKAHNQIRLEENSESTILLNGKNTIENFTATFDGDKLSIGAASSEFKFDGEDLTVKSGDARALLENISSDNGAAKILTVVNGKEIKTAIAQAGAVIAAGDELADAYYGEKSGVDFTGFESSLTVDLTKNFYGINQVTLGGGLNTLLGTSRNETLTSSDGTTEFIFSKGNGRDVIRNLNFDDDKISVGNETITAVNVNSAGGVRMEISGDGSLTLDDAQGKNFRINNFVALVDRNLTYNGEANYFVATSQNASLTVGESAEIWLDGSHGKIFVGNIRTLDASTAEGKTSLAGNDLDNTILAGQGDATLWGGNGGDDFLQGGAGKNTFFYTNGNGEDTIAGAHDGDLVFLSEVSLEQLASTSVENGVATINFKDGGNLIVNDAANCQFVMTQGDQSQLYKVSGNQFIAG